jgi:hypothetical protein
MRRLVLKEDIGNSGYEAPAHPSLGAACRLLANNQE